MDLRQWTPVAKFYDPILAGSIDATDTDPHDRGIIRALNSSYKPNMRVVGDPECTLFAGRLNHSTSEDHIKEIFSKYGKIKRCRLVRDFITGFSKGYAFVEYMDRADAKHAVGRLNHVTVDNVKIMVMFECERTLPGWIPRRLGGGLGGKKESGQLRFGGIERPFKKPIIVSNKFTQDYDDITQNQRDFFDESASSVRINKMVRNENESYKEDKIKSCVGSQSSGDRKRHRDQSKSRSNERHGSSFDNSYKRRDKSRSDWRHYNSSQNSVCNETLDRKHNQSGQVERHSSKIKHTSRRSNSRDQNRRRSKRSRSRSRSRLRDKYERPHDHRNSCSFVKPETKKCIRSQLSMTPENN